MLQAEEEPLTDRLGQAQALLRAAVPGALAGRLSAAQASAEVARLATVLRDPVVLALPPARGLGLELELARTVAGVREVTLWLVGEGDVLSVRTHAGEEGPADAGCQAARHALGLGGEPAPEGVTVVVLGRWAGAPGALVAVDEPGGGELARCCLELAVDLVGALLHREMLLAGDNQDAQLLLEAAERRLTRLSLDLHDGPLQDVAALGQELADVRRELTESEEAPDLHALGRRLEELQEWLSATDAGLRSITGTVGSPLVLTRPFTELLAQIVNAFRARTSATVAVETSGDLDELTDSQRVAVLRIVQEALSNARQHGEASHVEVAIAAGGGEITASVVDDGTGFDVEATLARGAARERQGLWGMQERARLLGGTCEVTSRPGGPTRVTVRLPPWRL